MPLQEQVYAQNLEKKHVVLSSDPKGTITVEWSPAGDPSGNDLQIVPPEIANGAQFLKLVNRGIVRVTDDNSPEVQEAFDRQRQSWQDRTARTSQAAQASIERTQANDTVTLPCCGPDSRGVGLCGELVPVREQTKNDKAPLCPQHAHLAPQYVPQQEQVPGTAEVKTVWLRSTIGARETQHA